MSKWIEDHARRTGDTTLLEQYRRVEDGLKNYIGDSVKAKRVLYSIFTDENGKTIPKEKRRSILYYMGSKTREEYEKFIKEFGLPKITDNDVQIVDRIRRFLGRNQYEGMFGTFGIDGWKFVTDYMPRFREFIRNTDKRWLRDQIDTDEFIHEMYAKYGQSWAGTKEVKFIGEQLRIEDFTEFAVQDDALAVLMRYVDQGYKKFHVGDRLRGFHKHVNNLSKAGKLSSQARERSNHYVDMSISSSLALRNPDVENFFNSFLETIGFKSAADKNAGRSALQAIMSVGYIGGLGARPWAIIRELMQPWYTLAPRFGNRAVMRGLKKVEKAGEEYYQRLMDLGIITGANPVINEYSDIASKWGKLSHYAMKWYRNVDEVTRAIGFATAEEMFDEAFEMWQRGTIRNWDEFVTESGLSRVAPDIADRAYRFLGDDPTRIDMNSTQYRAARDIFATKVDEDAFYGYRASEAPKIFTKGWLGRLFGQFGMFSSSYRGNLARGFRYGTKGQKAAFAGRLAFNTSAIITAFGAIGVDAKDDFLPWAPVFFSGGPFYELFVTGVQSFGRGYKGRMARAELARAISPVVGGEEGLQLNWPRIMPGSLHMYYLKKAMEYYDQGDVWKSFLSLTTAPVLAPGDPWF
jgi:hypothetical protein